MGCLESQTSTEYSLKDLQSLKIAAPDKSVYDEVKKHWDNIAKPLDGMGDFEEIISRIGAIKNTSDISLTGKALLIMCADNGIVKEGVSQSDSSVTLCVAKNMIKGKSSVAVMAKKNGIDVIVTDVGMASNENIDGIIDKKIKHGSNDFLIEPAMSTEDTLKAINVGIEMVRVLKEKGTDVILTGEMGIGNTTTSAAVCSAILNESVELITGRGAGLDDVKFTNKKRVISEAIDKYSLKNADAFTVLSTVGGFDIAALTGVCIAGAIYDIPIVLDGVITMTAGLVAEKIVKGVRDYLFLSHKGKEPASDIIAKSLGLKPVIDAGMALGEGTGAVMMMSLTEDALCVYKDAAVFSEISVEQYVRK